MEIIRGKHTSFMNMATLTEKLIGYDSIHLDIGTGDGRFVHDRARFHTNEFFIGLDACREGLHAVSRHPQPNMLFVIANAQALPHELHGLAQQITLNFPWGSLLTGLLAEDSAVLSGLVRIAQSHATLDICLNAGALAEAGWSLEEGADRVQEVLGVSGFDLRPPVILTARELKTFPSTWAKRLAFGRDPRAIHLRGVWRVG